MNLNTSKEKIVVRNTEHMTKRQKRLTEDEIFLDMLDNAEIFYEKDIDVPFVAFCKEKKDKICEKHNCNDSKLRKRLAIASETELLIHEKVAVYQLNPDFFSIDKQ